MGGQNEKYVKTKEDIVESLVKKGADLRRLLKETNMNEDALLQLVFMPNNWSLLHLAVWYGNLTLVKELIKLSQCDVNKRDQNGESPVFLAAMIDDVDIFKALLEHKNIDPNIENSQKQDLNIFVVIHDSKSCFLHINSNISPDSPEFERYVQMSKEAGSDNINKILEKIQGDRSIDIGTLSSLNVYTEKIPGGLDRMETRKNRGDSVNVNFTRHMNR